MFKFNKCKSLSLYGYCPAVKYIVLEESARKMWFSEIFGVQDLYYI